MAETAALLADEVFPNVPLRQWMISFHFPRRYLFATHPQARGKVLDIVYRAITATVPKYWRTLPEMPDTDLQGLPMEMVYCDLGAN